MLKTQQPNIFLLELGANDGLRGIKTEQTEKNLLGIFERVKEKAPEAKLMLAGMLMPPNMGTTYTTRFSNIFPAVAKQANATLIPFLLEGVAGNPHLNQADRVHPTAEGQKIMAETVWQWLEPMLEKEA